MIQQIKYEFTFAAVLQEQRQIKEKCKHQYQQLIQAQLCEAQNEYKNIKEY